MPNTVDIFKTKIGLDTTFGHGQTVRHHAESVVVAVSTGQVTGWGEGAPRRYVTGETLDGAAESLERYDSTRLLDAVAAATTLAGAVVAIESATLPDVLGNAAACALETALLDLALRRFARPVADLLTTIDPTGRIFHQQARAVPYSFVLESTRTVAEQLNELASSTTTSPVAVKVKAHHDVDRTIADIGRLRDTPVTASALISIDANGIWDRADCRRLRPIRGDVAWLEEPTGQRDWDEIAAIRHETQLPVMLDESITSVTDLATATRRHAVDLVNIRVSKFGGVIAAARAISEISARGMGYQLGVQVAEVGPLWSFGRHLATHLRNPVAVEVGKQDLWFTTPTTLPAYRVDRRNHLATPISGSGSGIEPSPHLLDSLIPITPVRSHADRTNERTIA
ncbi:MAG: enolase C-terminal domain-like protein [Gordonia sp. (in: high G+C Gram-positive bacteria)]